MTVDAENEGWTEHDHPSYCSDCPSDTPPSNPEQAAEYWRARWEYFDSLDEDEGGELELGIDESDELSAVGDIVAIDDRAGAE